MRLTYFGPLPPHPGGISQHGHNVAAAAVACGHHVQRLSWRRLYPQRLYPGSLTDPDADPGATTRYVADWHRPSTWSRVIRLAQQGDGLVMPWVTAFHAPTFDYVLRRKRGLPAIAIVHNALPHERHVGDVAIARRCLSRLDGAVVHAHTVGQQVAHLAPGLDIRVVPHPPNLQLETRQLPGPDPLRLLVFGYVRAYKGLELALDAVARISGRGVNVRLSVVGQFWEPIEWWQETVQERDLDDVVVLDDRYVPDSEVDHLFAAHHIVLAPYRSATQSGIVPLARAAGRPVVATDVGGITEGISQGQDGWTVPPGDAVAMADRVLEVAEDLQRYADASSRRAAKWEEVVTAIVELIHLPGSQTSRAPRG